MENSQRRESVGSFFPATAVVVACLALAGVGCSTDASTENSCSTNLDCEVGFACGADGTCVQKTCDEVPGDGCGEEDLICLETEKFPQGVCSRPECQSESDCDAPGAVCVDGRCTDQQCSVDSDCNDGERCNAFGQCTEASDAGTTGDAGVDAQSDGGTGTGDATEDTGDVNFMCDEEPKNCPTSSNPDADQWSERYCACVECTGDGDCGDGDECRDGTCKPECTQQCDSEAGGESCPSGEPYCISDCCEECVGKRDCSDGQLCVDGSCQDGSDGDCTSDSCPDGYSCNSETGKCEQSGSGQDCGQDSPNCPDGEFCNQDTGKCEPIQGGDSCGNCGAGCSCPGNLTCNQQLFTCTGCSASCGLPICSDPNCPTQDQICLSFGGQNICG